MCCDSLWVVALASRHRGRNKLSSQDYTFPFIERANQETIDLLLEARTYAQAIHGRNQAMSSSPRQLLINCEAMRLISRLARVMA